MFQKLANRSTTGEQLEKPYRKAAVTLLLGRSITHLQREKFLPRFKGPGLGEQETLLVPMHLAHLTPGSRPRLHLGC
jgi:hypothetical protein